MAKLNLNHFQGLKVESKSKNDLRLLKCVQSKVFLVKFLLDKQFDPLFMRLFGMKRGSKLNEKSQSVP